MVAARKKSLKLEDNLSWSDVIRDSTHAITDPRLGCLVLVKQIQCDSDTLALLQDFFPVRHLVPSFLRACFGCPAMMIASLDRPKNQWTAVVRRESRSERALVNLTHDDQVHGLDQGLQGFEVGP
jgi:hypothetical protein